MTKTRLTKLALSVVTMGSLLTGCGGSGGGPVLSKVAGTIKLDGKPLANAVVTFEPVGGGRPASGYTDESGRYNLEFNEGQPGAAVGRHLVRISTWREGYDNGSYHPPVPEQAPSRYNAKAEENPEMRREVAASSNTIDFELNSSGGELIQPQDPLTANRQ